ncbi:MAG: homoserine O-acetyltransferase [Kiritimatiellae bacterium]|nr:homoserine O-acetyltransferase [Kiritimatiellia bacterium]
MENSQGVGVVEPHDLELKLPEGGYRLESGGVLKKISVRYESCGAPMRDGNVIYICHALTGDAHVAGMKPGETKPSGWWEEMIGPGRAIDTNKWHVICANVLGGCSGTTGPMSINPDTGKPYGGAFPKHTFSDTVDVFRMLLRDLGVKHLAALIGGSYGGLQVMDWATRFPDDMDRVCIIASSASLNTQALAFDVVGRASIVEDPRWQGGDYYGTGDGKGPSTGLAAARQIAHITYLSRDLLQAKFHRDLQKNFVEAPPEERRRRADAFKTEFQIESYLEYQAKKFVNRFDANSYLHITRSMDLFDAGERFGSLEKACGRIKGKVLVASYQNDILFTEWQSKEIASALLATGKDVTYCHLEAGTGHDSFLTDIDDLSGLMGGFLGDRKPKVMKWQMRHYRHVVDMVREGARVVDIGCGDGTLLNVLRQTKKVSAADGVDIDIDRFKEAVADGNNCFWLDADEGLGMIPDRHYDIAVCSDTLQEVKNPRGLLAEALRIADEAIVTFPNFANYRIRLTLGLAGRLPVSKALPFQWYDTPNIHCITLKDFRALCEAEGIEIVEVKSECRHLFGKFLLALGLKNLGASRITARIRRKR